MPAPKLDDMRSLVAIKHFELPRIMFKNHGGVVQTVSIEPGLPLGLYLSIDHKTCVLTGTPTQVSPKNIYTITASNTDGKNTAILELSVTEAPFKTQRGEILQEHDMRQDMDTPRSQIENAKSDAQMMQSTIKPHEKFATAPMGNDPKLSQQTANNPEAEMNAANKPELTPSPSQKLQQQHINAAKPAPPTPTPGR